MGVPPAVLRNSCEKKSLKTMFKKKSEKLYDDMRDAIERKDRQLMSKIIRDRDYQPNHIGGRDGMTALHIATLKEDPEALSILLQLEKIDPNAKMSNGFTPFLLAAARGRMLSFEILWGQAGRRGGGGQGRQEGDRPGEGSRQDDRGEESQRALGAEVHNQPPK